MDQFEYQLNVLVKYVQNKINHTAFIMYQPGYITVCHFDSSGSLSIIADANIQSSYHDTFSNLYEQIRHYRKQDV